MAADAPDAPARLTARLHARPRLALGAAVAAVLVLLYAAFVQQELFVVVWLLLVAFFAHLALRFVRAFERIAGAAARLASDED